MLFNTVGRELQDSAWYRIMVQCFDVIQEFRSKIDVEYNGVQPGIYERSAPRGKDTDFLQLKLLPLFLSVNLPSKELLIA